LESKIYLGREDNNTQLATAPIEDEIDYPDTDGKPIAESDFHRAPEEEKHTLVNLFGTGTSPRKLIRANDLNHSLLQKKGFIT